MTEQTDLTLDTSALPADPGAEPAATDGTAPIPEPESYQYRMRDERYDLPRSHVDELARAMNRRPQDIIRDLQISGDSARIYREHRQREAEIAGNRAQVEAERAELSRLRREIDEARKAGDVDIQDPSVRYLVDQINGLRQEVTGFMSKAEEKEAMQHQAEEIQQGLVGAYSDLMSQFDENEQIDPKVFFGVMDQLGIARSDMSDEAICELTRRYIMYETPSGNGGRPYRAPQEHTQPIRDPRRQVRVVVPSSSSSPSAPPVSPIKRLPGESAEQHSARLHAALGGLKWGDLRGDE